MYLDCLSDDDIEYMMLVGEHHCYSTKKYIGQNWRVSSDWIL